MGWLVKGPRSNPDEELANRECGNQVLSLSPEEFVSQELCQNYLVEFENAQQRKVPVDSVVLLVNRCKWAI